MDPIYWAALFSFLTGAIGYIIVRFWILPITRYKRVRRMLINMLADLFRTLPEEDDLPVKATLGKKRLREMRRLVTQLVDLNNHDLPYWYRLVLLSSKESALNASEAIMRLENLPTSGQVRQCLGEAERHLTTKRAHTNFN